MPIDSNLDLQKVNSMTELRSMPILGFKIPRINTVYMDKEGDANIASSCFNIAYRKDCLKDKLTNWTKSKYMDDELIMLYFKAADNGCLTAFINVLPYLYSEVAILKESSRQDDRLAYQMAMYTFMKLTEVVQGKNEPFSSYGNYWMAIAVGNQVLDKKHIKEGVDIFLQYEGSGLGIDSLATNLSPTLYAKSSM